MKKAFLLSLGCSRNLVDSEVLLGLLTARGIKIKDTPENTDIAIVNTCGFIEDAKQESINTILQLIDLKQNGKIKKIIVTGCLSQRYPASLQKDLSEIDGIFGSSDFSEIPYFLDKILEDKKILKVSKTPNFLYDDAMPRDIITKEHSIYLKIQEGCSNRCTYCVIPDIRGPLRSRPIRSILNEIKKIKKTHNVKELLIVGQDTTAFLTEGRKTSALPELLEKASKLFKDGWIRLLYTHPAHFSDKLIKAIRDNDNICKYIDLPIQHANDRILRRMNRKTTKAQIRSIIKKIRKNIKDVSIRTTVIVGFPGETEKEFNELFDFLKEIKFERLGAFIYSQEEGTPAAKFEKQIPQKTKEKRFDKIMTLQQNISFENNEKMLSKKVKVLIDEKEKGSKNMFIARSHMDAPDVDGVIYVKDKKKKAKVGEFVEVKITGTMEYDLMGETI